MLTMISGTWLVRLIAGSSFVAALQTVGQIDTSSLDRISHLGATGLLGFACVVLWRKLQENDAAHRRETQEKDALLMQNYKSTAEALATNRATMEKMADTLDGIKEAVEHLTARRAGA